ncbi:hypothetical protein DCAR_0104166 [Daucus carota subsp. sativus]|nr:hypothetical protein DCAR_0104166 [Daucus carota subsp. sativus]
MGFSKPSLTRHNITTPVRIFPILLLVTIFLSLSVPCSSSSQEDQTPPPPAAATYFRVFRINNTTPYFLKDQEPQQWRRHKNLIESKNKKTRRKTRSSKNNNIDTRAFTTMLPKGFIPPSGSSPCHNDFPNSITFFCELSSPKP